MATDQTPISRLGAVTIPTVDDFVPIVHGGVTAKSRLGDILALGGASSSLRSLADLLALTGAAAFSVVSIACRTSLGDGGGGSFYLDPADVTSVTDGGTIFLDASNRRWKRIYGSFLIDFWFGVTNDGVSIDTAAMILAVKASYTHNQTLLCPGATAAGTSGGRVLDDEVPMQASITTAHARIWGDGHTATLFLWKPSVAAIAAGRLDPFPIRGGASLFVNGGQLKGFTCQAYSNAYRGIGSPISIDGSTFNQCDDVCAVNMGSPIALKSNQTGLWCEFNHCSNIISDSCTALIRYIRNGGANSFRNNTLDVRARNSCPSGQVTASMAGTVMTVTAVASGNLQVGQVVGGTGVAADTFITSYGTGTGGNGTYNISVGQAVASRTMTGLGQGLYAVGQSGPCFIYLNQIKMDFEGHALNPYILYTNNVNFRSGGGAFTAELGCTLYATAGDIFDFDGPLISSGGPVLYAGAAASVYHFPRMNANEAAISSSANFAFAGLSGDTPTGHDDLKGLDNANGEWPITFGSLAGALFNACYVGARMWFGNIPFSGKRKDFVPAFNVHPTGDNFEFNSATDVDIRAVGKTDQLRLGAAGRVGGRVGRYNPKNAAGVACPIAGATAYPVADAITGLSSQQPFEQFFAGLLRIYGTNLDVRMRFDWAPDGFGAAGYIISPILVKNVNTTGGAVPALNTGMLSVSAGNALTFSMPALTQAVTIDYSDLSAPYMGF